MPVSPLVHSSLRIDCEANFFSAQFLLKIISSSVRVSRFQKRRSESPCNLQRTYADVPLKSPPTPLRREDGQTRKAHNCNASGNSTAVGGVDWSQLGALDGAVSGQRVLNASQIWRHDVRLLRREVLGSGRRPCIVQTCKANIILRRYRMSCAGSEFVGHEDHVLHRIIPCYIFAFYGRGWWCPERTSRQLYYASLSAVRSVHRSQRVSPTTFAHSY